MTDKAWKRLERETARALGGKRIYFGTDAGDVSHPIFFVECKYRQSWSVWKHWEKCREQAKKQGKTPLLVIKQRGKKDTLAIVDLKIIQEYTILYDK